MSLKALLGLLGAEIEDAEEESFLLFSQTIPSQNLGFVDSKAASLDFTIGGRDLTIHQSPTILSSNRGGGTTGAVLWKITPLFASWISSSSNILFQNKVLDAESTVLELGCGISGLIGLALGPYVASYVLTDQNYVMKFLHQNIDENRQEKPQSTRKGRNSVIRSKRGSAPVKVTQQPNNIITQSLDWETDEVTVSLTGSEIKRSFEAVIACDCIYNDTLIQPLVQTCVDACKLRESDVNKLQEPTVVIVAQQLRSAEVFEGWLKEFITFFRVWRMPDEQLIDGLKSNSGFVIHIGVSR